MKRNNNIINVQANTSVSSIMGNVSYVAKEYILSKFPKDYFKEITIANGLISSDMREDNDDVKKKPNPRLSIDPIFIPDENDTFGGSLPEWYNSGESFVYRDTMNNYYPVLYNDTDEIFVWTVPNKLKINFELKMKVNSSMQKIDLIHYLRRVFLRNKHMYINDVALKAEVPKSIVKSIANMKDYDLEDNDQVIEFYDYLKQYSNGYVVRQMNLSSGLPTYQYRFLANILMKVEEPSTGDTEKISMIEKDSVVNTTISFELWIPTNYILESQNQIEPLGGFDEDLLEDSGSYISHSFKSKPNKVIEGKSELFWQGYVTDIETKEDIIGVEGIISTNNREIIDHMIENDNVISDLYEIFVYRDGEELIEGEGNDYLFDWTTLELSTFNPFQNYTHHVGLYGNLKSIKEYYDNNIKDKTDL